MSSDSPSRSVSVVVPALNERDDLPDTIAHLAATLPPDGEVIVVDDGSTDGTAEWAAAQRGLTLTRTPTVGVARARNHGARLARGNVIVFSDAHVRTPPGWWEPLVAVLGNDGVGAVAPAIVALGQPGTRGYGMHWPGPDLKADWLGARSAAVYPVPLVCGCFIAARADVFRHVGGFDEGMQSYGSEDLEFSIRLWLLGHDVLVVPQVEVAHRFRERHPYTVQWRSYLENLLRMVVAHFSQRRLALVLDALRRHQDFGTALAATLAGGVWQRREALATRRIRDDEWFFNRFHSNW